MKMIDNMYSFVTSGIGVYGPDMRVGTNSEVMVIDVHFELKNHLLFPPMYTMMDVKYTQEEFFMSAEFLDFIL